MKRKFINNAIYFIVTAIFVICISTTYVSAKSSVAILDINAKEGVSAEDASVVSDFFRGHFLDSGEFRVLERTEMSKVLNNQQFEQQVCSDETCALKAGGLLQVENVAFGTLGKFVNEYQLVLRVVNVGSGEIVSMRRGSCRSLDDIYTVSQQVAHDVILDITGKAIKMETVKKETVKKVESRYTPKETTEETVVETRKPTPKATGRSSGRTGLRAPSISFGFSDSDDVGGFGFAFRSILINNKYRVTMKPTKDVRYYGYYQPTSYSYTTPAIIYDTLANITTSQIMMGPYISMLSLNAFGATGLIMRGGFGFSSVNIKYPLPVTIYDRDTSQTITCILTKVSQWEMDWDLNYTFLGPFYGGVAATWGAFRFTGENENLGVKDKDLFEWQWFSTLFAQAGIELRMSKVLALDLQGRYPILGSDYGIEASANVNITFVEDDEGVMGVIPWTMVWLPLLGMLFSGL